MRTLTTHGLAALLLVGAATPVTGQDVASEPKGGTGYFDRPVGPAYCEADDPRIDVLLLGSYQTTPATAWKIRCRTSKGSDASAARDGYASGLNV